MRYDSLKYFAAPATGSAELWRTAAGAVLTFIAGLALYQLVFALVSNLIGPAATQTLVDATTFDKDSAAATLYILYAFGFFGIGIAMVTSGLHRRSPVTLFGPVAAAVSDAIRVVLAVGALYLLAGLLLPTEVSSVRNPDLTARTWILLLPVSLVAVLVQSVTEEMIFRGYLQQQLAVRFPDLPLWLIVPTLLFGFAHFSPGSAGPNAVWFALWAAGFGLAAADLTARTGTLGAAIGLHLANNLAAILFTALEGDGSGLALYIMPVAVDDPQLAAQMLPEFAMLFCGWLLARLALKV